MYAVLTEVTVPDGTPVDAAERSLQNNAVPNVRAAGAVGAYWLEPRDGRAVAKVLFPDQESARAAAGRMQVGERPGSAPDRVTLRSIEV